MSTTPNEYTESSADADHGAVLSHVEPDDIGVGLLTVVGALVAVVVLLIAVLLQAWFYNWKLDLIAQRSGPIDANQTPAAIAADQLQRIETYGWADPKTKKARTIPIDRAMELEAAELARENGGRK